MSLQLILALVLAASYTAQSKNDVYAIVLGFDNDFFYCLQLISTEKALNITCLPGQVIAATLGHNGSVLVFNDFSNQGESKFYVYELSLSNGFPILNRALINQTVLLLNMLSVDNSDNLYGIAHSWSYSSHYSSFVVVQPTTGEQKSLASWNWMEYPVCFGCNTQPAVLPSLGLYCYPVVGSSTIFLFSIDGSADPMQIFNNSAIDPFNTLLLTPYNIPSQLLGVMETINGDHTIAVIDIKANTVKQYPLIYTNVSVCSDGLTQLLSSSIDLDNQLLFVVIACYNDSAYTHQQVITIDVSSEGNFSFVNHVPLPSFSKYGSTEVFVSHDNLKFASIS